MGRTYPQTVTLLVLSLMALAACATASTDSPLRTASDAPADRPAAEGTAPDAPTGATTPAREVFFPTLIPRSTSVPDAMGGGTLIVDGRGCLRLRSDESSATPLWPPGFELHAGEDGLLRVVDGRGRVRAKVGEKVLLGGGYTKRSRLQEGGAPLKAKIAEELYERCPGWYFLTQEDGTKILR